MTKPALRDEAEVIAFYSLPDGLTLLDWGCEHCGSPRGTLCLDNTGRPVRPHRTREAAVRLRTIPNVRRRSPRQSYPKREENNSIAKQRRAYLKSIGRCICGPIFDMPDRPIQHGPPVSGGRCQRCMDKKRQAAQEKRDKERLQNVAI